MHHQTAYLEIGFSVQMTNESGQALAHVAVPLFTIMANSQSFKNQNESCSQNCAEYVISVFFGGVRP